MTKITPEIKLDSHQNIVKKALQALSTSIETDDKRGFFAKTFLLKTPKSQKLSQKQSLYIYGDVGRGKSMLMKEFFDSINKTPKTYFHFNLFMRQIHESLRDIRNEEKEYKDELFEAVQRVVKEKKLICFDEFQVTDIADAMLLSRIFSYLFSKGVTAVFTSNSKPEDLYKNGLQREVFLEFVTKVLLKNCQILNLNSPTDYRGEYAKSLTKRYFIFDEKEGKESVTRNVTQIIEKLTKSQELKPKKLKVWGREIQIKQTFKKIAVIDFSDLCKENYAASDYQTICQNFNLIFLLNLPKLSSDDRNEAKRFTLFIDEVYENKTALIVTSEVETSQIYNQGTGSEAFKRTVSRLQEMKSDNYWQESKIKNS